MKNLILTHAENNTFIFRGETNAYKIIIENDLDCDSPREYDNLGTLALFGRNCLNESDINDIYEAQRYVGNEDIIVLPVYKYEHGGVAYSTTPFSCRWDSGMVGYIYTTKSEILSRWGGKYLTKKLKVAAFNSLVSEVDLYSAWANGDVYGYVTYEAVDMDNDFDFDDESNWEQIDSCWGFIEIECNYEKMYCLASALENIV